jgi:ABC-type glycerol-3-phosphate transport system substrate-binding protein
MRMRRIALCLALLVTIAACGGEPTSSDTSSAAASARRDGSQMGTGSRTPTEPADTTGLGIGTMGNGN